MKKNLIALLLAVVMASSSVGAVPVVAAETNAPETVAVEETVADGENAAEEASVEGNATVDETEVTNEAATYDNESAESIQDQSTEDESETLDEEQETIEEDDAEESLDQDAHSTDETEPQEAELENTSENELTAEQIQAFQEKIKIWKHDNQITIVYDSTEDVRLSYHLYSVSDGGLLYEGNLHWNEENGLYYEVVDFDAVNEAEHRESDEIDITDISVKAVIEVITEQGDEDFDSNANSFEEVISDDTGIVSITDVDTKTDGKINAKWDCTEDEEIDGYYVIVRRSDGNDSVLVYDTDQLTDNADDDAYTQEADSQITLNTDKESVSEITVAAYKFDDDTGVKHFGKAATRIIAEDEDQSMEEAVDSETVPKDAKKGIVASGTVGAALKWTVYDDGRLTISGTWDKKDTDRPWLDYSFNTIIIESGIKRIGGSAFYDCSTVTSVTIPNTVTYIGRNAFLGCENLRGVTIPSSVTEIDDWAFYGCTSLASVSFPSGLTRMGNHAFYKCTNLKSVSLPNSLATVEYSTFYGCTSLAHLTIPDSVTSIEFSAFCGCSSLTDVTLPKNLKRIEYSTFYECTSLAHVTIPDGVTNIAEFAFGNCEALMEVTLPDSVTGIGTNAFQNCTGLASFTIPSGVTVIELSLFSGCTGLTEVTIPSGVTIIAPYAFRGCTGLTEIVIPGGVKSIGNDAFRDCTNLKRVTIPKSVTSIGSEAFNGCNSLELVYYYGSNSDWDEITIGRLNDPLLSARKIFIDGSSSIKLDSEFTCNLGETITVSATYSSSQDIPVTASVKSDVGAALEFSGFSVLGPFKVNSKYESYISFMVTGKKAGEYNLTLTASDGTTAKTVIKVNPIDISNAEVKLDCPDQYNEGYDCVLHTGSKVEPEILEVKVNGKLLTRNKDYTASYSDNINCGLAKVSLNGIGNYKGQKIAKFYVVPEKVTNLRYADTACGHRENGNIGAKHRALEVAWDTKYAVAGYIVEYSEDRTFPDDDTARLDVESTRCYAEGLDRDTVYYVRVTPCIIVGTVCFWGERSDVFEYRSCNHLVVKDFWGFHNPPTFTIDKRYYERFFTPPQAEDMAHPGNLCYGMSYLAIDILNYGYPPLSAFNISSLYEVKEYQTHPLLKDYLFYSHIMQQDSFFVTENIEINDIDSFLKRVEEYTTNGGHPVSIGFRKINDENGEILWSHALVALDIVAKDNSDVWIRIYDPNCPGTDKLLIVTGRNGVYTNWAYTSKLGILNGNTAITRDIYENHKATLINKSNINNNDLLVVFDESTNAMAASVLEVTDSYLNKHYNDWRISISNENNDADNDLTFFDFYRRVLSDYDGTEINFWDAAETDEGTKLYFWVPKTSDNTLNLEGAPAGSKIHIAGNMHSVTVQTDAECDLSICLPETGEGEVHASSDGAVEIQAEFFDFDEDGDKTKTSYSASGNAETPIDIVKNPDDDPDAPLYSGTCGSNLTWSFDESGILRISGTGAMYNYDSSSNRAPWRRTEIMTALKSVIIKNGVTKIGDYAFTGCNMATSVWIPDSVASIGRFAFFGCKGLEKVKIPEGVTSIGDDAFYQCTGINTIEIPSSVESIGSMAFSNCTSLKDFIVDSDNATYSSIDGTLFNKDQTELICCPAGKKGLYSIPDGVVKIGTFAFNGCNGLTGVSIPVGVSEIGGYAFYDCTELTSIAIPSSVTRIEGNVCCNCSKLSKIYFIGTQEQWNSIYKYSTNSELLRASIVYVDNAKSLSYAEVTKIPNQKYTGRAVKPNFEVQHLCKVLEKGKDYTVSYFDNVNAGTATAKVSGAGEYTGSASASFTIEPKSISLLEISGISTKTYTGKAQTQAIVVEDGYFTLTKGTDYDVTYANNVKVGTASVVITGKGNYTGTVTKTFAIKKAPNTITAKNFTKTYSTKAQTFSLGVKVKNGTPTYKSSSKYVTVSKAGKVTVKAKYIGKATITITSPEKAYYSKQTKKITVTVNPTKTALVSVTSPSAGKMTVKWKKNAIGTGYQIQYSATSKFTNPKYTTITKNSTLSKTIGSLVKGKKYYVRIRTKKIIGKSKYFSAWSAAKAVTIKK